MIAAWKRQAIEGMSATFSGAGEAARAASDAEVDKLHAKIGQLLVERDFFSEGLRSMSVAGRREWIDPAHHSLSIAAQCRLLSISRSSLLFAPVPETKETLMLMRRGFLYLVAIMDWATRKVLAWRLSNTMDAGFCVAALEEALARFGRPEIFNTDQGIQFISFAFTRALRGAEVRISMDGRGRWMDNVFIERLWRSLKYECVYLHAFETDSELRAGLGRWITYYNHQRPHSGLVGRTPAEAYRWIGASDHGGHAPHDLMTKMAA